MKKLAIFLVLLVVAFVGATQYKEYKKARLVEQEQQVKDDQVKLLRQQIVSVLKDPSSVQWRGEFLSSDRNTLCGEVNAKNSLGGYVGFKKYVANSQGYLIEGGGFKTWSMKHNKTPVPDYMVSGARLSDEGQQAIFAKDVFEFFWKSNCTE